jgi:phage terminase large subunit-like protein
MHLARSGDEAMIGRHADQAWHRLGRIDAAHSRPHRIAARGEIARVTQMTRRRDDEIAVERQDHVSGCNVRQQVQRTPVRQRRTTPNPTFATQPRFREFCPQTAPVTS